MQLWKIIKEIKKQKATNKKMSRCTGCKIKCLTRYKPNQVGRAVAGLADWRFWLLVVLFEHCYNEHINFVFFFFLNFINQRVVLAQQPGTNVFTVGLDSTFYLIIYKAFMMLESNLELEYLIPFYDIRDKAFNINYVESFTF